ncbi:MAG: PQQ-dependent sugar dehydrogenase [Pseudomonadales bacterium]|nr:PQQ-dependent sugar dehydrogenase [Pseudomonadales bacterium]
MKRLLFILFLIILIVAGVWLYRYLAVGQSNDALSPLPSPDVTLSTPDSPSATSSGERLTSVAAEYSWEVVAKNLTVPWSVVFIPDETETILVAERPGSIRAIRGGSVSEPLITLPVTSESESGLMGMTIDPDFTQNSMLYACYTYQDGENLRNRIVSLRYSAESLTIERTLLENAPAAMYHSGCELGFGPDGMLYASFGDAREKTLAQDTTSLAGKIIRITADGSIPSDNPDSTSPVWSYGHRNPQGFDWTSLGQMYSVEHGPSGNDGPLGGDELNHIVKGENYGWPVVSHTSSQNGMRDPLLVFTPAVAPASLIIYTGDVYAELKDEVLFANLKGSQIIKATLELDNPDSVVEHATLLTPAVGRLREIVQGPDGFIYVTTSNTDGRGEASSSDDMLLKLLPKQ